jgi:hypothetical protein
MREKLLNSSLVLTSLIGYLEWGGGHSTFLFQAEVELFSKGLADPASVIHPLTLLPVFGQLALVVTIFQKSPGKGLTYFGIAGIGVLLALMFVIGLISLNPRILSSTLPFLTLAALTVRQHSRARAGSPRPPVP